MNDKTIIIPDKQPAVIPTKINMKGQTGSQDVSAQRISAPGASSGQEKAGQVKEGQVKEGQVKEGAQQLQEKVTQLNRQMQSLRRDLQFTVDEATGEQIIKVIDVETKEVIRQIPSEELLKIRESIDNFKGILFESKV